MKKLMILTVVFSLLSFSCDWLLDALDESTKTFWAQDMTKNEHYKLNAKRLAEGKYCKVWVEIGSDVSTATAQNLASIYDSKIYQKMISKFSERNFEFLEYRFSNILELADELTDGDGKLTILLLDIKDGYKKGVNDSFVQGYFWAGNFFDMEGSNLRDMIYIDTYPGEPDSEESCKTLAHELQHLMNFTTTLVKRSKTNDQGQLINIFPMDTWIDEGLASAAEWVYSEEYNNDRISWYNNNGAKNNKGEKVMSGSLDKGNNFFVWGNHDKDNQYAILDDYATVYLFFQWLRLEGGNDIYKEIITSDKDNYNAVVNNINGYSTWESLLETWLAANKINSKSGKYGYREEITVNVNYAPKNITTVQLYPGEAVYSLANTNPNVSSSGNIVYKYITSSGIGNFSSGTTLLTYNKNSVVTYDDKGKPTSTPENGTVTGTAPAASISAIADGSRAVSAAFSLPYRIDAGDLLRRGGAEKNLPIGEFSLLKEKFIEEEAETNE